MGTCTKTCLDNWTGAWVYKTQGIYDAVKLCPCTACGMLIYMTVLLTLEEILSIQTTSNTGEWPICLELDDGSVAIQCYTSFTTIDEVHSASVGVN